MTTAFRRFLFANALNDLAQWLAFSSVTFLVLEAGGIARVALVQGAPLLLSAALAPFLGALVDRLRAERVIVSAALALALVALGYLRFDLRAYAALMVAQVGLVAVFGASFAKVLPAVAGEGLTARALGRVTVVTGVLKTVSIAVGPLLARRAGTAAFLVVAALFAASAALFASLPSPRSADDGERAPASPAAAEAASTDHALRGERAAVLALWVGACACQGIDEAVAMDIAGRHLHVPPAWSGFYPAMASAGGVAAALVIGSGRLAAAGRVAARTGALLSLRAMAAALLVLASSPAAGFALKLVEGALANLVALLTYMALVLRAPEARRGRLQGLFVATAAMATLGGKAVAGALGGILAASDIYGGAGLLVAAASLLLTARSLAGSRAASAPR